MGFIEISNHRFSQQARVIVDRHIEARGVGEIELKGYISVKGYFLSLGGFECPLRSLCANHVLQSVSLARILSVLLMRFFSTCRVAVTRLC